MLEQLAVQIAEAVRRAEGGFVVVVLLQKHAEVVVAHVRREVIPDDPFDAFVVVAVNDIGLQDFNQRKRITAAVGGDVHFNGDDVEFDRVAIPPGVVPMRQAIEAPVDHLQRVAQILLATRAPCQIGEVGRDARAVGGLVIFIKRNALDVECECVAHGVGVC
ncbi:hypothetical protein D3C71_1472000 [compost metagenome]